MSEATVNQLRLVHQSLVRLSAGAPPADAAEFTSAAFLLGEVINELRLPDEPEDIAAERARIGDMDRLAAEMTIRHDSEEPAETIDLAAITAFLREVFPGETARVTAAQVVSRGMSKKTILVTLDQCTVLSSELALRADRSANNYLGTHVADEWGPVRRLWDSGARIPQPFALEPTGTVIGDPFIVFARASGAPVGSIYVPPTDCPDLIADAAIALAGIHRVPVADWPRPGQPQGAAHFAAEYADYLADWQSLGAASPIVDASFAWVERHRALAEGPPCVTHNDFAFNNMLVEGAHVTAVLDWEFAHVGTPAADLGYFRYSADAGSSFAAFLAAYRAAGGTVPADEQIEFYTLWGQLRLAVMGFKSVRNLEQGRFDHVRYSMSRFALRKGLLRLADLLERLG